MATQRFKILVLLGLYIFTSSVQAQIAVTTTSTFRSTTLPTPSTTTEVYTPFAVCATGGGDWYIDPPTATQLADLFCDEAYMPGNLPAQGQEFDANEYPTDLIPVTADDTNNASLTTASAATVPNYTLTELSGVILAARLVRWHPKVIDNVTYVSGTQAQCDLDVQQDQCRAGLRHVIDKCQWNSHYFGGVNFWLTGCGMYSVQIANCSGNWLDPNCDLWHRKWPDVGSGPSESFLPTTAPSPTTTAATAMAWRA
ncbi:uncharacterized protein Z519_10917 [Cladophialophora bantiana CBS 173.52]|uniref:Uncharacterized protein n=1 Tax=Cladophialophora bantiana (strain ATCC 10958 / CBS 173.52 / CDC B-1940 / NIH 8579) TaxID=1442370 RepID=A0A0D2HUY8_CLAB1|nr:uncharacterized protein Z519_10917 [Cladophialophora bantiana CBS 173.52]KIW88349.1 hypothetical protein Z519_10917 [Cladophialophora bantiana CBS 173.52]